MLALLGACETGCAAAGCGRSVCACAGRVAAAPDCGGVDEHGVVAAVVHGRHGCVVVVWLMLQWREVVVDIHKLVRELACYMMPLWH